MPAQAQFLVNKMRNDLGDTEFTQSWKLVTLFIGGNDLCACCKDYVCYLQFIKISIGIKT